MSNWWKDHPDISEKAKQLASAGKSAKVIADELSRDHKVLISRNAVIGFLHREGAPLGSAAGRPKTMAAKKPTTRRATRTNFNYSNGATSPTPPKSVELPVVESLEASPPKSLLENDGCNWPVGDNLYCGRAKTGKRDPYCAAHQRLATANPRPYVRKNHRREF